mmetsp:Transcript_153593/g.268604  ORF Transcript_153593/g.268604 Transcript_153593/m.268604 type:complete len:218 (-) Transcript_153593:213-866(-)
MFILLCKGLHRRRRQLGEQQLEQFHEPNGAGPLSQVRLRLDEASDHGLRGPRSGGQRRADGPQEVSAGCRLRGLQRGAEEGEEVLHERGHRDGPTAGGVQRAKCVAQVEVGLAGEATGRAGSQALEVGRLDGAEQVEDEDPGVVPQHALQGVHALRAERRVVAQVHRDERGLGSQHFGQELDFSRGQEVAVAADVADAPVEAEQAEERADGREAAAP